MRLGSFLLVLGVSGSLLTPGLSDQAAGGAPPGATTLVGQVERDLTGDGAPEVLRLVAMNGTAAAVALTFTIESGGRVAYRFELRPQTHMAGPEFAQWFFGESKFQPPDGFVSSLRAAAPRRVADIPDVIARDRSSTDTRSGDQIWREIQSMPVTIFTFSPGGDTIIAIGWSERAGQFYPLLECC